MDANSLVMRCSPIVLTDLEGAAGSIPPKSRIPSKHSRRNHCDSDPSRFLDVMRLGYKHARACSNGGYSSRYAEIYTLVH